MFDYILEKGIKAVVFWVVGLVAMAFGFWAFSLYPDQQFPSPDAGKWQAVFLDNGQVYFGHLVPDGRSYVKLSNVYYLRTAGDLSDAGATINLIKLGGELHGPEDVLHIPTEKILYWENLKDSSALVQRMNK
jgi:hypothetical protein